MAEITSLTEARTLAIEAATVVSGAIVTDNLILTKRDASTINAGNVRGPQGATGPIGSAGPAGPTGPKTVRLATTANDTLSGLAARDGITPSAADLVLVLAQTTASANGIYSAASGAWTRATIADTALEVASLGTVQVLSGTVNGGKRFMTQFKSTDTLGTTAMNWIQLDIDDTGWVNIQLTGAWVNYDSGLSIGGAGRAAQYRKIKNQMFFRGVIRSGVNNTAAFTLAAGLRPANSGGNRAYTCSSNGGYSVGVTVDEASGAATPSWAAPADGSAFTFLTGIYFLTD